MLGITEAEEDGRLELRHVFSPVTVDLPGLTAQDKCVLRAPRFESGVGAVELVVGTDMHGVRSATGCELHALDHVRVQTVPRPPLHQWGLSPTLPCRYHIDLPWCMMPRRLGKGQPWQGGEYLLYLIVF